MLDAAAVARKLARVRELLKQRREQQKLSQKTLEHRSGVEQPIISRVESRTNPDLETLFKLLDGLAWPAGEFFAEIEHEEAQTPRNRSADKERSMLARLVDYFKRFDSIADMDAAAVREWMTARKRQVQASTVNRELDILKRLMATAVPKYLERSPIAGLRRFRVEEHEPRILTPSEEAALLAVCSPSDKAFLLTAIDTLLRLSNVVFLKWPQVKLDRAVIVPLNAKVSLDSAPISRRLDLALRALPRQSDWVFPQFHERGTGKTAAKNRAIRRFHDLCQAAHVQHGRAAGGVTFHCLRHTGATRALQRGASVRTVMKLGGWRDESSVMRYVHAADADVRAAAESISAHTLHSRDAETTTKTA